MGRIEVVEGGPQPPQSKDDSRQSESDTENNYSDDVEELRTRLRERDLQVATLKGDKDDCVKQISDLKNQLYQLVSSRMFTVNYITKARGRFTCVVCDSICAAAAHLSFCSSHLPSTQLPFVYYLHSHSNLM